MADPSAADDPRVVVLVARVVTRDQAAFAELYDLYVDHIRDLEARVT